MSRAADAAVRRALAEAHRAAAPLTDADILEGPRKALEPAFTALDRLAALDPPEGVVDRILREPSLADALRSVHRLRRLYGLRLEIERAEAVLRSPDPWETLRAFPFYPNYERLADMEARGAGLGAGATVVFLGSGPLPKPADLVMVAAAAAPQGEIFDHLARGLPEGALVSHRVYEHGLRRLLDLRGGFTPPPVFREIRRIPPRPPVNNTVVIFRKARGA